ncbi:MAG TPA: ATP-dependent RNA helicase, partial [Alteromonas macleodii]|nr:ATP-dependent RNA helicase [Alteromonas macleodii]
GRAGRQGDAILFISHREKRLLFSIEKTTKQPIEAMPIPSISEINETRLSRFKQSVAEATQDDSIESLMPIVEMIKEENEASPEVLMAALLKIAQGDEPLILKESDRPDINSKPQRDSRERNSRDRDGRERKPRVPRGNRKPEEGMQRFRIEVGHVHGAKPGNIVGAIANEANINSKHIGAIEIYDNFSTVDLPEGMPKETRDTLQGTRVAGQRLNIREWSDTPPAKGRGDRGNRGDRAPRGNREDRPNRGDRENRKRKN